MNITPLKPGDKAPKFQALNQNNKMINSDDFLGSKLILFFYPRDNTPGCTAQACNLRDNYSILKTQGFQLLGVSPDTVRKHINFIKKHNFPFDLLADTDLEITKKYGVWGEKKFMGRIYDGLHRTTFIIDEAGIISHIIGKVKTKTHSEQILEILES